MPDKNTAPAPELPSSSTLLRSTGIAAAVALVLLVTTVLPAEYGVDPTGIGRVLGLTEMGEIKMQLAREAAAAEAAERAAAAAAPAAAAAATPIPAPATPVAGPDTATTVATSARADTVRVSLRPGEGREVKLVMRKGALVAYTWSTDRGALSFETHGDTLGAPPGVFHSYSKGRDARSHGGTMVAVFDGMHGWFWRNRTREVVTVTLRTEGDYQELKRMD